MNRSSFFYDIFESTVGTLFLIFSGSVLAEVSFKKPAGIAFKKGSAPKGFIKELVSYFNGSESGFSQKIKFHSGTDFEKKVWTSLKDIPYGGTRTYKWVAERAGNPSAVRAAGRALSKNPLPVILPCHRVIESDGSLGGYSSGTKIKIRLLELEYYSKQGKKQP